MPDSEPWNIPPAPAPEPEEEEDDEGNGWPTLEPLTSYADPIPTDALGPILGPMVDGCAETFQVPSDVAVTMALPLITCAACGRWTVKIHDDWSETMALATISVLESSGGKTPTLNALAEPLREFARQARDGARQIVARETARHTMLEERATKLRRKVADIDDDAARTPEAVRRNTLLRRTYNEAVEELAEHVVPHAPRFMVDDVTPEALAMVMAQQCGAVGIVSDEAGIFGTLGGRYSAGQSNLDVVLKGVSGTPISIDRKGTADPIEIDHPALSISVAVQPGLMARLGDKPEFRESGMLGRFLPVIPRSIMGERDLDAPPMLHETVRDWSRALRSLAAKALELRDADERRELEVKPAALAVLNEFRARLEPEFLEGGALEHLHDFGGKLAGNAARMAGAFTLLADPDAKVVDDDAMRGAVAVAEAYIAHAAAAFGTLSGANPASPLARVSKWIKEQGQPVISQRTVHLAFKKKPWARTSPDIVALLQGLEAKGHVRKAKPPPRGEKGGAPPKNWEVSPDLLTGNGS